MARECQVRFCESWGEIPRAYLALASEAIEAGGRSMSAYLRSRCNFAPFPGFNLAGKTSHLAEKNHGG